MTEEQNIQPSMTVDDPAENNVGESGAIEAEGTDALIAELEKAGVTTAEQLGGKLEASRQAGQMAQLLGDARNEIAGLKTQLTEMRQGTLNQSIDIDQLDDDGQNGGVDLEKAITRVLRKEKERDRQQAVEARKKIMQSWGMIQNDKDYPLVKEVWERKISDPNFNLQVQSGQINPATEYMETVREFYKGIAKRSLDAIKTLKGGGVTPTPNVEGPASIPGQPAPQAKGGKDVLDKTKERVDKGARLSEDEELAAITAALS
ncbi:MAG: hypothetical protein SVY53_09315 [Chloroflexota bacterium]|nr:hypothetical protein [Chloroflexota bacterium]